MQFEATTLQGAWLIRLDAIGDDRGFFARTFCVEEFAMRGLETHFPQHSISLSLRKGTVRGMHYQCEPHTEVKLIRCSAGAIWDVIIDIRPWSPTYGRWQAFELSPTTGQQLYVPKGFAHGFQTLAESTEVNYLISEPYMPGSARGINPQDPSFAIPWPLAISVISERDRQWPPFATPPGATATEGSMHDTACTASRSLGPQSVIDRGVA